MQSARKSHSLAATLSRARRRAREAAEYQQRSILTVGAAPHPPAGTFFP